MRDDSKIVRMTREKPRPYPNGLEALDPDCRELAEALNDQPGIVTTGCCCGHDRDSFFMGFKAKSYEDLAAVMRLLEADPEYRRAWHVRVEYSDKMSLWFSLLGPCGACGDRMARALRAEPRNT